jgi:phosphate transport system permease protein
MTFTQLAIVFLILVLASGILGWRRIRIPQLADGVRPRSRAIYHGLYNALWCALSMLLVVAAWMAVEPGLIRPAVLGELAANSALIEENSAFKYVEIKNLAEGVLPSESADESVLQAVEHYRTLQQQSGIVLTILFITAGLSGLFLGYRRLGHLFPARERVEGFVRVFLFVSASVAILTTISIVLALAFETLRFFQHVPVMDFLLGTKWSPQVAIRADQVGSSGAFGMVPLFAGTLLIALIAMLVAVPVGLFSAIYLAEYAHPVARSVLKPMLEVLAGIPTVVYGFFAALTVAPMIVDLGHSFGLDASSESALAVNLTANPLESVTTVTAQIVTILVGDQEFDSPKTLAAFALGLTLFFVTLALNFMALHVVRKYREQYD